MGGDDWELIEKIIERIKESELGRMWRKTNKKIFLPLLISLAAYYVDHKLSMPKCESDYLGRACSKDINNDGKKDYWVVTKKVDWMGIFGWRQIFFYYFDEGGPDEIIFKDFKDSGLIFKITRTYYYYDGDKGNTANETFSVLEKIKANNYCWRVIGKKAFEYKKYRLKRETIENYVVQKVGPDYYRDLSPSIDDEKEVYKEVYKVVRLPFCSLPETLNKIMFVKTVNEYDTESRIEHGITKRYFDLDADGLIDISYEINDSAIEKVTTSGHYHDEKNFESGKIIIDCRGWIENFYDTQYNKRYKLFHAESCEVEERDNNNDVKKKVVDNYDYRDHLNLFYSKYGYLTFPLEFYKK